MADHPLILLSLDDLSRDTIKRLSKVLGIRKNLRIERKGLEIVNKVARDAVKAYQAKVPIYTGELRNTQILMKPTSTKPFDPEALVYVADTIHQSSWDTNKPTGAGLAVLLDSIKQRRSRKSQPEDPFTSARSGYSRDWMAEAEKDLKVYIHRTLGL